MRNKIQWASYAADYWMFKLSNGVIGTLHKTRSGWHDNEDNCLGRNIDAAKKFIEEKYSVVT